MKLLSLFYLLLSAQIHATSFSTEIETCPVCTHDYTYAALMSWNTFMSGGSGPPPNHGECPHCLSSWTGKPGQPTKAQKKRHLANINRLGELFSANDRNRLLNSRQLSAHKLERHLQAYSSWVRDDSEGLKIIPWKFSDTPSRSNQNLVKERKEALAVLERMKRNKEPRAQIEADLGKVFMTYIADWITLGDSKMATFSVGWILWVPDSEFADSDYSLLDLASSLHQLPPDKWPPLPAKTVTDPIILQSLNYLRQKRNWDKDFDQALVVRAKPGRAMWLMACAAARKDPTPTGLILSSFNSGDTWQQYKLFVDYFRACGTKEDLKKLARSHQFWLALEKKRESSWEVSTLALSEVEEAMLVLRVRLILEQRPE